MTIRDEDEGIRAVRDARKMISAECGNDPVRLVERYVAQQEHYRKQLIQHATAQQLDSTSKPGRDR